MKQNLTALAVIPAALLIGSATANAALPELGAKFEFSGTLGANPVSGSIYDKDIHSGVFRDVNQPPSLLSGAPVLSDSYVLQGGDPFGGDTGDDFEKTKTPGHATIGSFAITTTYTGPDGLTIPNQAGTVITSAPDTAFLTFKNNSLDEFIGTITLSGEA